MRREESLNPEDLDRPDWNSLLNNYSKHDIGEAYLVGRLHQAGLVTEQWGIDMRHEDEDLIYDDKMDLRLWEPRDGQERPPDADDDFTGHIWAEQAIDGDRKLYETAMAEGLDPDPSRLTEQSWRLKGVCDVKTKSNEDWMCALNVRHLAHYANWADRHSVPVFLFFTMVDPDAEEVGTNNAIVPVRTDWEHEMVANHFDTDGPEYSALKWDALKARTTESSMVDRVSRAPDGNPVAWIADDVKEDFDWIERIT